MGIDFVKPFVSVLIPCLNEELSVESCVSAAMISVEAMKLQCEVVVIDNGSTDSTATVAREAGAKVVFCERQGYGAAVQCGVDASSGSIIIVGDGDGSYDFSDLVPFIRPLLEGAGVVLGNRFNDCSPMPGAMPWSHEFVGNPALTYLLNVVCRSQIKDAHCGLRSFTRIVYHQISPISTGFEFCSEMLVRAVKCGVKISQVPIVLHPTHVDRKSKLRTFRDGLRHLFVISFFFFGRSAGSKFIRVFRMS